MPVQTLGIFDKVFDWVYDKLLSPVVNWLASILSTIFEWIFENILQGFLEKVFKWLWEYIGVEIANFFYAQIYALYCGLLELVDIMQYGFDVLIGLQDITYVNSAGQEESTTLLNYIIFNDTIRTALVGITFIALALTILFAIYSVIHSSLDFDFENKRPVGKVMSATFKTMMTFLFIPLIVWVGLNLASIVLKQTAAALSGTGGTTSISDTILLVSSMKAHKDSGVAFSFTTSPWSGIVDGSLNYMTFAARINIAEIDYLIGFAAAIFCLIIMLICLFSFIRRIYDIVLLYIVSPYFASTMVLDDGQKFSRWRETFIGKVLVGFGSALGMRLFLMLIPMIMGDEIQFFDNGIVEATAGYILKLIFILGGMYAVYKSSSLLTSIISTSVAQTEQMDNAMLMHGLMKGGKKLGGLAIGAAMNKSEIKGAAPAGNKQPIPESPSLPSDALKINGMKGATPEQAAEWKKKFGGLEIKDDYEQTPTMHIDDVENMGEDMRNLFGEDTPNTLDVEDMSKDMRNLFGADTPNILDVEDMSNDMRNLFGEDTPNILDVEDMGEDMRNLFGADTPNTLDVEDMSKDMRNLFGADTPNSLDVEDMSKDMRNLFRDDAANTLDVNKERSAPDFNGFAAMVVGRERFNIPIGYTAMPKLVPIGKAEARVAQMKRMGDERFGAYYDAVANDISSGSYQIPRISEATSQFSELTQVSGNSMHVPEGYTVIPEIMKVDDAVIAANNFRGGKNEAFYSAYASAIQTPQPERRDPLGDAPVIHTTDKTYRNARFSSVMSGNPVVRPMTTAEIAELERLSN